MPAKQMSYKARKRWALAVLLIGMPIYVVVVLNLMTTIDRLPFWGEVAAYVVLGVAWIFPFKRVFLGVGQPDPDAPNTTGTAQD
jgi:Protein of unknown function (DUF2842)